MSYPGNNPYGYGYGQQPPVPPGQPPSNHMVEAILVMIFCCQPFGILAIIRAAEVNSRWAVGDYHGAQKSSEDAAKWSLWGAITGFIVIVIVAVLWALAIINADPGY